MKLLMLFGANTEDEYAEVLTCWSEYDVDGNYEGWLEEIDKRKKERSDMSNFGVFSVDVSGDLIYKTLTAPTHLDTLGVRFECEAVHRGKVPDDDRGQDE